MSVRMRVLECLNGTNLVREKERENVCVWCACVRKEREWVRKGEGGSARRWCVSCHHNIGVGKNLAESEEHTRYLKTRCHIPFMHAFAELLSTVCINDLDKMNLVEVVWILARTNFCFCSLLPQKMKLTSKVVKSDSKIIISFRQSKSMPNSVQTW